MHVASYSTIAIYSLSDMERVLHATNKCKVNDMLYI